MNTNRPRKKVPFEPLDIIVECVSISLFVFLIIYTFLVYQQLPDTIPTHFSYKGEVDDFGSKSVLVLLPILGIVLYVGLFFLNKYPHIHNYMVNITEENALKNYRFSTRIVRYTNLFLAIVFTLIQYMMIVSAQGKTTSLGSWIVPTIIGVSFIIPIFLIIYQYKLNK
jgi:uncharacterized membrane protein